MHEIFVYIPRIGLLRMKTKLQFIHLWSYGVEVNTAQV